MFLALFKCPEGLKCDNHICKIECNSNEDCFKWQTCGSGFCEDECSYGNIICQLCTNYKLETLKSYYFGVWAL